MKKHLPQDERNFKIVMSCSDAHELLRTIGPQLYGTGHLHYFLLYDPYDATIDWEALLPFFRNWGEVMINHMVSDPVRAITSAKKKTTKAKEIIEEMTQPAAEPESSKEEPAPEKNEKEKNADNSSSISIAYAC